ncbi:MAG: cation:proton antiporter, partial [Candidatus Aminicenantes bacterium]|nr:cation:proton antiporter [Candidatus Aminicenantes bacterium]
FLMFYVGLEIRVKDLFAVGRTAILVGILGAIFPLLMGIGSMLFLGHEIIESLFVATAILATSVGISAKVLKDLGLIKHKVAYIVLGAAVLDDIFALIILALVKGLARGKFQAAEFVLLIMESLVFIGFLTLWGPKLARRTRKWIERINIPEGPFVLSVILCLGLAELADIIGLAAIIGAFMAGVVIDELAGVYDLENKVKYVNEFLLPFFFVMMGAHLNPRAFLEPDLLFLVLLISVVAAVSKMIGSALACWNENWRTRIQTGVCMIPRGEVGIIVGLIGISLQTITQKIYTVVLGMSLLTTIITPPLIVLAFRKKKTKPRTEEAQNSKLKSSKE